jgi:hypothetical protein
MLFELGPCDFSRRKPTRLRGRMPVPLAGLVRVTRPRVLARQIRLAPSYKLTTLRRRSLRTPRGPRSARSAELSSAGRLGKWFASPGVATRAIAYSAGSNREAAR